MESILGAVITYNPELSLLKKNLDSFETDVDYIIIIDNGSIDSEKLLTLENDKIKICRNNKNLGIAEALNFALDYAIRRDFQFILTMDQDSFFERKTILPLVLGFQNENTAIVCPVLKDMNSNDLVDVTAEYFEVFTTITSGSLCSVKALEAVGGFDSKMFIDYVDVELCLRLQMNGFKILRSKFSTLCHHLGESKKYSLLAINFIATNHSPLRNFYFARNKIYVYRKYFGRFPVFVFRDILSFCKTIVVILFFEQMKKAKIRMICKGIWHGFVKI